MLELATMTLSCEYDVVLHFRGITLLSSRNCHPYSLPSRPLLQELTIDEVTYLPLCWARSFCRASHHCSLNPSGDITSGLGMRLSCSAARPLTALNRAAFG
ncbi:hypothetical protein TRVL_04825 [Trypanosoma vivax]|nr:hypothetical protein TRVL_04825 [Trypanosoma vivax]